MSATYVRRVLWGLFAAVTAAQAVFVALNLHDRRSPWDLEMEYDYPALMELAVLGLAALLCLVVGGLAWRRSATGPPRAWIAAGLAMAWLFIDGAAAVHERIPPAAQPLFDRFGTTAPPWFWVVGYFPVLALCGASLLLVAARNLSGHAAARRFVLSGLACWAGAVLTEPVGLELWQITHPFRYTLAIAAEETLEVMGALFLVLAFGLHGVRLSELGARAEPHAAPSAAAAGVADGAQ